MSVAVNEDRLWSRDLILLMAISTLAMTAITTQMGTLPLYVTSLGGSNAVSGAIVGILGVSALMCRFPIGVMLDVYGRRLLLIAGLAILVLDFTLLNICRTLLILFCLRFVQGIGNGIQTTASMTMASDLIPPSKFHVGIGYFTLTSVIPSALGPLIGLSVVEHFGFDALFAVGLVLTIVALSLSLLLRRQRAFHSSAKRHGPADEVKTPDKSFQLLMSPSIILPSAIMFVVLGANSGVVVFISQFAADHHINGVGFYFLVASAMTALVRLFVSPALVRVRESVIAVVSMVAVASAFFTVSAASGLGMLLLAAALYGVGQANLQPIMNTLVLKGVEQNQRGRVTAFFSAATDVAYGGGALLWGGLSSIVGLRMTFVVCGVCAAMSLPLYALLARLSRRGR